MKHQELIAALTEATGPNRLLDALLDIAVGNNRPAWARDTETLTVDGDCVRISPEGAGWFPPHYTAIIDAAMGLVPPEFYWLIGKGKSRPTEPLYGIQLINSTSLQPIKTSEVEHDSLPICLCIAALRTRALNPKDET